MWPYCTALPNGTHVVLCSNGRASKKRLLWTLCVHVCSEQREGRLSEAIQRINCATTFPLPRLFCSLMGSHPVHMMQPSGCAIGGSSHTSRHPGQASPDRHNTILMGDPVADGRLGSSLCRCQLGLRRLSTHGSLAVRGCNFAGTCSSCQVVDNVA